MDRKTFIALMQPIGTTFIVKLPIYAKTYESAVDCARALNATVIGCMNEFGEFIKYTRKTNSKKDEDSL